MTKQKKANGGKNRRQQGNGQAHRKTEQKTAREGAGQIGKAGGTAPQARRKPRQADDEQKRKLWDRKQAELATRRAAAESRRMEEDNARKRTAKMVWSATGMSMVVLAGTLAWYFA